MWVCSEPLSGWGCFLCKILHRTKSQSPQQSWSRARPSRGRCWPEPDCSTQSTRSSPTPTLLCHKDTSKATQSNIQPIRAKPWCSSTNESDPAWPEPPPHQQQSEGPGGLLSPPGELVWTRGWSWRWSWLLRPRTVPHHHCGRVLSPPPLFGCSRPGLIWARN